MRAPGLGFIVHFVKLQQGPRERQRVWELARSVGRSTAEVLALLKELGESVASWQSYLELPVIRRVYERLGSESSLPSVQESRPGKEAVDPPASNSLGLSAPAGRRRRLNNHPLLPLGGRAQAYDPTQEAEREGSAPVWSSSDPDDDWARNLQQTDASLTFAISEWMIRGFTEAERDAWLAGGLRPGQAKVAAEARDYGLRASDLGLNLNGWTIAARLQRGEGGAAVARLFLRSKRTGIA